MLRPQKPIYLVICIIAVVAGVKLYTYYIEKKQENLVQKLEAERIALQQAPLQQSNAVIRNITFTPEHTKTVYYPAGKYKTRSQTHTVKESYEVIFHIQKLNKEISFKESNVSKGKEYKKGDPVLIEYKEIKSPATSKRQVYIIDYKLVREK